MSTFKALMGSGMLLLATLPYGAQAAPVVYTLRTVADGGLGRLQFQQARVTLRLIGDTENVHAEKTSNGHTVYVNREGQATVTVTLGNKTLVAHFARGEIYARYDVTAGIVGFGSAASPTYPVALGCANVLNIGTYLQDCAVGTAGLTGDAANESTASVDSGIVNALADPTSTPQLSAATQGLPTGLRKATLLTGIAHTCPGAYTFSLLTASVIELGNCQTRLTLGTDSGPFYLQDGFGFSVVADVNGDPTNFSVDHYANVGSLQVEVKEEDEE
jgi:hypothetical protein